MPSVTVTLSAGELELLRRRAAERGQPVESVMHEAVTAYLSQSLVDEVAWRQRLASFLVSIRGDLPTDIPLEQIEADITAAREEVRQARRAARRD